MQIDTEYIAERQKFDDYCNRVLIPALQPFEDRRKKYLRYFSAVCLGIIIWVIFLIYAFLNGQAHNSGYDIFLCLIVLAVCWPMFMYYKKSKESILPILIKYFGDFNYIYHPHMPRDTLNKTLVINHKKELNFEEGFEGQYAGMQTRIMEYSILKQYKASDSNNKYIKKQDYGIIFTSQMKKMFKGQTIVVSDRGIMNKFLNYKGLDRVTLESPEFEKIYEVFSDDQVEARYILTAVMLEYMVELKKLFKKIEYSFFNNELWINIAVNKNSFECSSFFRTVINKKRLEKTFKQLYLLFSIIKILRLDQDRLL